MRRQWCERVGAGALACSVAMLVGAGAAAADRAPFPQGCSSWTVPNGVSSVQIDASGAAGGSSGGSGDDVSGTVGVTHGQTLYVCVGVGGSAGGSSSSGAGGGASGVSLGSNFSLPKLVAAGGGGRGAGTGAGSGGNAGLSSGGNGGGTSGGMGGTQSGGGSGGGNGGSGALGSGGPGGSGNNGGGGGGAGYYGGGGGGGSTLSGGGGGGGSDYCPPGCSHSEASASQSPHVTLTYAVASPPTTSTAVPAGGAVYARGQSVASSFSCAEGASGPGISSCTDQNGRPSGSPIDTSTTGRHTFTVTAQSSDGLSSSSSVTYAVAAPPRVWLPLPANGATYTVGQVVHAFFQCADGSGGPGLKSCADQNGRPSGAAFDTSTTGTHTYTATATSQDGLTASATVSYQVVPQPTVSRVQAHRGGIVTLQVTVYAPGAVDVMNTASFRSFRLAADVASALQPPAGSFVFGNSHAAATGAQTLSVRVGLSQAGKLLLRDHRRASLTVWVLYTAPGGIPQLVKSQPLPISR